MGVSRRSLLAAAGASVIAPRVLCAEQRVPSAQLSLALDCSSSMYGYVSLVDGKYVSHAHIQLLGYRAGLADPIVQRLLIEKSILLRAIAWSQPGDNSVIVPDTIIGGVEDIEQFSATLGLMVPGHREYLETIHASLITFAESVAVPNLKHVIDVCSDEAPFKGKSAASPDRVEESAEFLACRLARDAAFARGTTINILPIDTTSNASIETTLSECLKTPDGISVPAVDWWSFVDAMVMKMQLELRAV